MYGVMAKEQFALMKTFNINYILLLIQKKNGHQTLEKILNMFNDISFDILEETREELIKMFQGEHPDDGWSDVSVDSVSQANLKNALER